MRLIHASLLVGAAVLGLGAFALPAVGKDPAPHEITIQLPGGGTETIRYTGHVAPKVRFDGTPFAIAWLAPTAFDFGPSFAAFDQVAADLDRQMSALWRQAQTMANWPANGGLSQAGLANLGPGTSAYTVVSQSFGNKVCTRVTEVTSSPNGGKPKVVSRTSGNCDGRPAGTVMEPNPSSVRTIADHRPIPATTVPRTAL